MFGGPMRDTVASARSLTPQCVLTPLPPTPLSSLHTRNIWPVDRAVTQPYRICCIEKFTVQVLKFLET